MKSFKCQNCGQLLFFENTQCLQCGYKIGYIPDAAVLSAIWTIDGELWQPIEARVSGQQYRLCLNYRRQNVCNWLVPAQMEEGFCRACRLNETIPNLSEGNNWELWSRLEAAKRRLVYSLLALGLPVASKEEEPARGLAFAFLDTLAADEPVSTGHTDGLITINIAEADNVAREQTRVAMNEPYRTLLGHFRHESGHYYWLRLIQSGPHLEPFRHLFGDEQADYQAALARHYNSGAPADWQERYVSAYAASHPWEDWAETWAHYLHITDAIETAQEFGISLRWQETEQPRFGTLRELCQHPFTNIVNRWLPLTYALNSLNRSLGQADMYPFVLSPTVMDKLSFVHEVVKQAGETHPGG